MVMVIFGNRETEKLSLGQQKLKDSENNWVLKDLDRVWPWLEKDLITHLGEYNNPEWWVPAHHNGTISLEEVQS